MKILLLQLDGSLPNLALMRLSSHFKALGDDVVLWEVRHKTTINKAMFLEQPDLVFSSLLFEKSRPLAEFALSIHPGTTVGGTGWDVGTTLESIGIKTQRLDYSIYPTFGASIGFSQRGCRLACKFCVVPKKEGKVVEVATVADIWRGEPYPRHLILLDNDFFGQQRWRDRVDELCAGEFKVNFSQGINARMLNEETAQAIANVRYYDQKFKTRRIYTAWDNRKDVDALFRGLNLLVDNGVQPFHIMVYMLIGYWPGETEADWLFRHDELMAFGALPYPMPYVRNPVTVGFQRWVVRRYSKRVSWERFKGNNYKPEGL